MKLIAGSRGSALALRQTNWAIEKLKHTNPDLEIEVIIIKTKGDKILDVPLAKIGDKGLFVKELEVALLNHEIDFAVHSMKDLPVNMPAGLCIAAVPERTDPSDVLVTKGLRLTDLPPMARIGTSSVRRKAQLYAYRADLCITPLRGNLDTRLRKLDEGEYDGIIVAYAGLYRMGWIDRITEKLSPEVCLPAAGQGALAIQARSDDKKTLELLQTLDDHSSHLAILAERSFLEALGGGCQIPIGVLGEVKGDDLTLSGVVVSPDGRHIVRNSITGNAKNAISIGQELAQILLASGAEDILNLYESS
jgi:hydroxymethylbilane synthase